MKRKQASIASSSKKRPKQETIAPPVLHPHGEVDHEKEYKIKGIIGEKGKKYHIEWENDEATGAQYEPTWEPKENANQQAIDEWIGKQAEILKPKPSTPKAQKGRGRPRRIIESSPEISSLLRQHSPVQPDPDQPDPQQPNPEQPNLQQPNLPQPLVLVDEPAASEPEISESQPSVAVDDIESPLFEPLVEPTVELSEPPSSLSAYQKFTSSDVADSSGFIISVEPSQTSTKEQTRLVPVKFAKTSTRVIPDSQSAIEFSSSAPVATTSDESQSALSAVQEIHPAVRSEAEPAAVDTLLLPSDTTPITEPDDQASTYSAPPLVPPVTIASTESTSTASASLQQFAGGSKDPESSVLEHITVESKAEPPPVLGALSGPGTVLIAPAEETSQDTTISYASDHPSEVAGAQQQLDKPQIRSSEASLFRVSQHNGSPPSSFGFQTQPIRPPTNSTTHSPLQNGDAVRLHPALLSDVGVSRLPAAQISPVQSSLASGLLRSIGTLGESAPPRPAIPSSPFSINSPTSPRVMETSQSSQRSGGITLAAKLRANQEKFRAQRQSSVPKSMASRIASSQSPAPSQPSQPSQLSQPSQPSQIAQPAQPTQLSQPAQAAPQPQPTLGSPSLLSSHAPKLTSSLVASEQNRRSPSSIPAVEPTPIITQEEMNTSERYETLLPPAKDSSTCDQSSSLPLSSTPRTGDDKTASELLPSANVVPIEVLHHQRDQYQATVRQNEALVKRFLATSSPDAKLAKEAECFVERMRNLTQHPDLDNIDVFTQYDVDANHQAQWDINCSAKFRFLEKLCDSARDQGLHFAIVAQPNRLLDMLATFFTNIGVSNQRLADMKESGGSTSKGLTVTMVSVNDQSCYSLLPPAHLVIAMDPTVTEVCAALETVMPAKDNRSMHVTLAIPGTVDHVGQSISSTLSARARLRTLVNGIYQYNSEVGKLTEDQLRPEMAAQAIAQYHIAGGNGGIPFAALGVLPIDSQTEHDLERISSPNQETDRSTQHVAAVKKRALGSDEISELGNVSKKTRYDLAQDSEVPELPMTINPMHIEITHVSDSIRGLTQLSASTDAEPAQHFLQLSEMEQHLRSLLTEAQDRLKEHVEALSDVQLRIEEHRERLIAVSNSRDSATATSQQAVKRMTETMNKFSALKVERTDLKQQLDAANARLLDHAVPERAELEALRQDAARIQAEKEQLEKRLQSAHQENEYSREMYQTSSQSATNFASQNSELESQVALLRNKATSELVRLRQMGYDAQTTALRDENKKLKALLMERDSGLKCRDEEIAKLKEASRGRMGTRGTSVPRSPRLRSPVKEGMRAWGSRQGSPAVGEGKGKGALHPLRQG